MVNNRLDLLGQRFGKLVVIEYVGTKTYKNGNKFSQWLCRCDCGGTKIATGTNLKRGVTTSCGCAIKEAAMKRDSVGNKKHGYHDERLYKVWKGMKNRCRPSNKNYGERGIKVCNEWAADYMEFRKWALGAGYDENAKRGECTLDRIDVNGDYCPENCRWVDQKMQMNNTRYNKKVKYNNDIKTVSEWADVVGINRDLLYERLFTYHLDVETAFSKPIINRNHPEGAKNKSRYRMVEYNGEVHTINEWSKITGIRADTLWARIFKLNWDVGIAFTKPVINHNKGDKRYDGRTTHSNPGTN